MKKVIGICVLLLLVLACKNETRAPQKQNTGSAEPVVATTDSAEAPEEIMYPAVEQEKLVDIIGILNGLGHYSDEQLCDYETMAAWHEKCKKKLGEDIMLLVNLEEYLQANYDNEETTGGMLTNTMNHCFLLRFNAITLEKSLLERNLLTMDEINSWYALQKELLSFCTDAANLLNIPGSISVLTMASARYDIFENRVKDLVRIGKSNGKDVGRNTLEAEILKFQEALNHVTDSLELAVSRDFDDELFQKECKDICSRIVSTRPLLEERKSQWLLTRLPDENTAKTLASLAEMIKSFACIRRE